MPNETMIICPHEKGGYAVRPIGWAGIWDEKGRLKSSCNFTALFREESDAKEYCEICNNPLAFSANKIRNELLKHGDLWDAFLVCIESTLKERNLPFVPDNEIAEAVLQRVVGDDGSARKVLGGEVTFEAEWTGELENLMTECRAELKIVDITGFSENLILKVISSFPETEKLVTTDLAHYETLQHSKGFVCVAGGEDLLYGRPLIPDYRKKIKAAKVGFSVERK